MKGSMHTSTQLDILPPDKRTNGIPKNKNKNPLKNSCLDSHDNEWENEVNFVILMF